MTEEDVNAIPFTASLLASTRLTLVRDPTLLLLDYLAVVPHRLCQLLLGQVSNSLQVAYTSLLHSAHFCQSDK